MIHLGNLTLYYTVKSNIFEYIPCRVQALLIAPDHSLSRDRQGKDLLSCDDQAAPGLFRYPVDGDERQAAMLADRAALTACQVDDGYDIAGMDGEITAQMKIHGRPSFCIWQRGSR